MNVEQLSNICELLGGQTATARLLGLKSNRFLRKCINEGAIIPKGWNTELREIMAQRIQSLNRNIREIE